MLEFQYKPEKFASAAAYLAEKKPGITKKELCKLLFFADKEHLLRYGRTITGDAYCALPQGPVPSIGLDALNGKGRPDAVAAVRQYGKLNGWAFVLDRYADLKVLSKSDIRILDEILDKYGHLAAWELEELSHKEPAWLKAPRNRRMDFLDLFDGHPEADTLKAILIEEEQTTALSTREA